MRPRVVVSVLIVAAACGGKSGTTTTGSTASTQSTGSTGGTAFSTGASSSTCGVLGTGGQAGVGGAPARCKGAPTGVTYAKDIAPIFAGCMGDVCHAPWEYGGPNGVVNRPTAQCCDGRSLVQPGDPDRSYLVNKLDGRLCSGRQMPLAPNVITPAQIDLIVGWICEGAPNN